MTLRHLVYKLSNIMVDSVNWHETYSLKISHVN